MRVTLSCCLALLCLGCDGRADGARPSKDSEIDSGTSHDAHNEDARQDSTEPARLNAEWFENPLPDEDLTDCEVTTTWPDGAGNSPNTFRISYDAATRTLSDAKADTVFDANGHAVLIDYRPNAGAPGATNITYDEHGRQTSNETDGQKVEFENEYDEQGRLTAVVTKAETATYRDEYFYEDELNPMLWSRSERDIEGIGHTSTMEREVASERQLFMSTYDDGEVMGAWVQWYRNQHLESLEQYQPGGLFWDAAKPNGRSFWTWDEAGNLRSYVSGGTWGSDLGSGSQFTETYSSGCQELVRHFPSEFHLPRPDEWKGVNH